MTDLESCTPRIVFYKYPKVTHSIRNITNEIDNRVKEIKKKNETLENLCPIPKNPTTPFKDKQVLHLLMNNSRCQNKKRQTHKTTTINNSYASYHWTETMKSISNKIPILHLQRNKTSLFKRNKTDSFFKRFIPTAFTENESATPMHLFNKNKKIPFLHTDLNNKKTFKMPRPYSSINFNQQNLIELCDKTIEESSQLHQNIVSQNISESKSMKKKYHSQAKENYDQLHEEIPFEKVPKKYYIYHLGHFISKNQGIKDNLIIFQNISKISPSESYNMRNILGEEIGYTVDTKENEINLIQKDKNREHYQKPKWINISDKKGRIRFMEILKKSETNKRELARVIDKYQLISVK